MSTNVDPSFHAGQWLLFDIAKDPGETNDLAQAQPGKMRELVQDWEAYAKRTGVILPASGTPVGRMQVDVNGVPPH